MITIFHTNDFHGKMTPEIAVLIRSKVDKANGLYFDSGDCITAGNLAIPLRKDKVWDLLSQARCRASVPGNRESHVLKSAFEAKISGHQHPLLCANMRTRSGDLVLPSTLKLEHEGTTIGLFGVMVPMVTKGMKTQAASAFLWDSPFEAASRCVQELRNSCDFIVALTHIGIAQDRILAQKCPEIDLILGGHSHTILQHPEKVGNTAICQAGSHGRFLGQCQWEKGKGIIGAELISLED